MDNHLWASSGAHQWLLFVSIVLASSIAVGAQVPKVVSVKSSTSIVESLDSPTIIQTSTTQANQQVRHEVSRPQRSPNDINRLEPMRVEPKRQPLSGLADLFGVNRLSVNGKILEHSTGYRRSVSTSANLVGPFGAQPPRLSHNLDYQAVPAQPGLVAPSRRRSGKSYNEQREEDAKCHRRSLALMLMSAKSLLTDGFFTPFERLATPGNLMLGSGILAAAVPLAALALPDARKRRDGSEADATSSGKSSLQARVDSLMGWIERSVERLPNFPRLHPQECIKRSICEAHNDPNKYGAIGFMLRLFFPASNFSSTDTMDNMEYKVINKYRHAAGYGLARRLDSNNTSDTAICREKYEDCLVSLLDVARNLVDVFLK